MTKSSIFESRCSIDPTCSTFLLTAERGHSAIFELLLAAVDIDANIKGLLSASLVYACSMGHVSIVRQLFDINASGYEADRFMTISTPLIAAYRQGNVEIINLPTCC